MKEKFSEECKIIQQNCTYTAEAHHQRALSLKRMALWLEVIPSICAAVTGTLVAAGKIDTDFLYLTIISSVVTAVAAVLSPSKSYQEHLGAAKNFTALKHDARFLHETLLHKLSDEAFSVAVENIHQKYNELVSSAPPTDDNSFKKAQKVIQAGNHDPDKDEKGNVK